MASRSRSSRSRSRWCEMDENGEWQCGLDSDDDEYPEQGTACALRWNYSAIERIVLMLSDRFGFRIEMTSDFLMSRGGSAMMVPAGLALAGGAIGRHLIGGRAGAAIGGVLGGALGVGVIAVALRDVWESIKSHLPELFEIVFDYLAGLGVEDYHSAILMVTSLDNEHAAQLARIVLQVVRDALGKNVISSLPAM